MHERAPTDPHRAARLRLAGFAVLIVLVAAGAALSGSLPDAERVRSWADGYGAAGPLLFILGGACLLCMFVPGPVVAGAAGLLFGTALGTPVALAAIVLGAVMQLNLGRRLAGPGAAQMLPERVRGIDAFMERNGFWAVFYVRLTPALPYNLVNYGAGMTRLRNRDMAAGTAVGAAPRSFAWAALGGNLDDLSAPEAKAAVALLVAMAVVGIVFARRRILAERAA